MNSKALVVASIVYGLLLSALLVRNGHLLSLAVPFLVYLILGALQAPTAIKLTACRTIDRPSVAAREPVETHILIKNQGNALVNLYLNDELFASMTILDGRADQQLSLPAGEAAELRYVFGAARGVYSWTSIRARAADPFGLFELEQDITAFGEILIRPAAMKFRQISLKSRFTLPIAGPIPARRSGSGCDFWGIREYRTGDSLQRLNWRLAARHPRRLFTNEYEREEIADFGLILDARRFTDADATEEALFESSVSAAASLSEAFLKQGDRVALLVFGETMRCVFPGYGKKQLNLVLRSLARATLGTNLPIAHLGYMPARLFPSRSIIVIFSSLGPQDLETYSRLRAYGHDVLLISPNPVDYASQKASSVPMIHRLAVRAARVERTVELKRLMKLGVKVIDWQIDQPLETIVQRAARHLAHRGNV